MTHFNNRFIKLVFAITLLALLAWAVAGCEDYGQLSPPPQQTTEEAPSTVIQTEDIAIMAVYEHLLTKAESYQAKLYLADFYSTCDNWSATSELFKDGTRSWHVVVDMTGVEVWEERPYWQQASWYILKDGTVIPSNRFQANALRIEADLQELSLPTP